MQNSSSCPMGVAPPLAPDGVRQDLFPAAVYVLIWRSVDQGIVDGLVASPLAVALMNFVALGSSAWLPFVAAGQVAPSPAWTPLVRHIQGWDEAVAGRDAPRRVAVCGGLWTPVPLPRPVLVPSSGTTYSMDIRCRGHGRRSVPAVQFTFMPPRTEPGPQRIGRAAVVVAALLALLQPSMTPSP